MTIIGLTGPTGSGKSSCSAYLSSVGIPTIDADRIYHDLIASPSPCTAEIAKEFGKSVLDACGGIDRKALAAIVFSDLSKRKTDTLNRITHKYVLQETVRLLSLYDEQEKTAVVVDAPLLFEAEFDRLCDFCISVLAEKEIRKARILIRDDLTSEQADARLNAQKSDEYYAMRSDYIIKNDSDIQNMQGQLKEILIKEGVLA